MKLEIKVTICKEGRDKARMSKELITGTLPPTPRRPPKK